MSRSEALQTSVAAIAAARRELLPPEVDAPSFGQPRATVAELPANKRKWPWLVGWAVVVIVIAVLGLRYYMQKPVNDPIALGVVEHDGQLHIEWNHAARPVTAAVRGSLVIKDGDKSQTFPLSPRELTAGNFTYERKTGDVEVRMSVDDASGGSVQEASRYVGRAPMKVDQKELTDLKAKRDELQATVDRLTRENFGQQEKIQQLQRTLQIMQTRSAAK
jgi:hypothetical protein